MQTPIPFSRSFIAFWQAHRPHPGLLGFLVLLVNVKLAVKALAILSLLLLVPALRRTIRWKELPPFYPLVMAIALLNWILHQGFSDRTITLPFLITLCFWIACLLAVAIMSYFAERLRPEELERTLAAFFLLNALVVVGQYAAIVWETGAFNPYRYQGDHQKYFIGTGDYLKGIPFDTSITNAALNAFGLVYFLRRRRVAMAFLCTGVLLYAGSNLFSFAVFGLLLLLFAGWADRLLRSAILVCLSLGIVFFGKVSPQNGNYAQRMAAFFSGKEPKEEAGQRPFVKDTLRRKAAKDYIDSLHALTRTPVTASVQPAQLALPVDDIHSAAFQDLDDTTEARKVLIHFLEEKKAAPLPEQRFHESRMPGKWIALAQSLDYLVQHPQHLPLGLGAGNYSSKMAFRATALGIAGSYPQRWKYLHPAFEADHFALYLHYFSQRDARHSVLNAPDSVYDHLLSEYGIAGMLALVVFYLAYFVKRMKDRRLGIPLILLLLFALGTGYWFEQLSLLPFVELLLFTTWKKEEVR